MIKKTYELLMNTGRLPYEDKRNILLATGFFARSMNRSSSPLFEIDLASNGSTSHKVSVFTEHEGRLYFGDTLVGEITDDDRFRYPFLKLNDAAYQIFNQENEYWERALSPFPKRAAFLAEDNTKPDANIDDNNQEQFTLDNDEKEGSERWMSSMI